MSSSELPEYAVRNRARWTKTNAEYTHDHGAREPGRRRRSRGGLWGVPEAELNALPDVAGKDVVELGCGTAYFSAWLGTPRCAAGRRRRHARAARDGAARCRGRRGSSSRCSRRTRRSVPLPDASFDLALSEYGASIWCDPYRWIPEAARLLRPGGELVFLRNSTLSMLCAALDGWHETLQRPQRGLQPARLGGRRDDRVPPRRSASCFALLRETGFDVLDLIRAVRARGRRERRVLPLRIAEWAKRWPWEEIWRARKR